jgi:Protein of unknown function (DUF4199)
MLRTILLFGLIAGLIVGVPMVTMMLLHRGHQASGYIIGYLTMLIALSTVFVAIKRHRDAALGGVIKFLPALGIGLGISAVAGVIYVLAWELSVAFVHLDFAAAYSDMLIAQQRAKGVSGPALDRFIAEMDRFRPNYANPLYRLPMTFAEIFPVGVLVSLVSAALLRNSRFLPARRAA